MTHEELLGAFKWNADGSWSPITKINVGARTFAPHERLGPGESMRSRDIVAQLEAAAARHPDLIRR